jgi:hypothetical protein
VDVDVAPVIARKEAGTLELLKGATLVPVGFMVKKKTKQPDKSLQVEIMETNVLPISKRGLTSKSSPVSGGRAVAPVNTEVSIKMDEGPGEFIDSEDSDGEVQDSSTGGAVSKVQELRAKVDRLHQEVDRLHQEVKTLKSRNVKSIECWQEAGGTSQTDNVNARGSSAKKRGGGRKEEDSKLLSSLACHAPSIPKIPRDVTAGLILPFEKDRTIWNSVCCARKVPCSMPPCPTEAFNLGHEVRHVLFSPCGTQLAFCINNNNVLGCVVHVWDRWGKETLLEGQTRCCPERSSGGECLASGSLDGSIRLWHACLFNTTSSTTSSEGPSSPRTRAQANVILPLISDHFVTALSFSRTESNVLASGGSNGEIMVWNAQDQACIHTIETGVAPILSLLFAGGADSACIAAS